VAREIGKGSLPLRTDQSYTSRMWWLALFVMRLLEVLFFVGIIGSAVVVLITSIEDVRELIDHSEEHHPAEKTSPAV